MSFDFECANTFFHSDDSLVQDLKDNNSTMIEDCCWLNLIDGLTIIRKQISELSAKITNNDINEDFNNFYFNVIDIIDILFNFYKIIVKRENILLITPIIYETNQDFLLILIKLGLISKKFVIFNTPLSLEMIINKLNTTTSYFDYYTNIIESEEFKAQSIEIKKNFILKCNSLILQSRNSLFDLFICYCQYLRNDNMNEEFNIKDDLLLTGLLNFGYRNLFIFILFSYSILS